MLLKIQKMLQTKWFWLSFIFLGFSLEAVALYYQYVLEELPCILCIHFRLWTLAMILVAGLGLIARHSSKVRAMAVFLLLLVAIIMIERSYQLLGVERGFIMGVCSMDLGLPQWFTIDKWMPWLFEAQTTCGYTPYIIFKISMAEVLMVFSVVLTLVLSVFTFSLFKKH